MRLAEEIIVAIAGQEVELRASLRRAIQLERRPGGFAKLIRDLDDLHLGTMAELIGYHDPHPMLINRVFDAGLMNLREPLVRYAMAIAGIDPDDAAKAAEAPNKGKTIPLGAHLADLFRLGSGWLGWTPDETLDASPAEIMEAYRGRLDMLKAIFGSGESDKTKDDRPLDDKVRSIFAGLGTVKEAS